MNERFGFYSISKAFFENVREQKITQSDFYGTLFAYAFSQSESVIIEPEETTISRILSGERSVSNEIIEVYEKNADGFAHLRNGVTEILNCISDRTYFRNMLKFALTKDKTVSENKRNQLTEHKSLESFVTACILYSFSRRFISRKKKKGMEETQTFHISDFLHNYHYPKLNSTFLGREKELKKIHERLKETNCLFLQGIGGIGKSELAKQYGKQFKKEYENVIFLRYSESIFQTICNMQFVTDEKDMNQDMLFKQHYHFFQFLDEKALVILDNFDMMPENEELFHDFMSLSFSLIVTTRNQIEDVPCYQVKEIQDMEALSEIFYKYSPQSINQDDMVKEIIEEVYRHTLTVEMAAKTMTAACLTEKELLLALKEEGLNLSNPNKIRATKDANTQKDCLYQHLKTLFKLQTLSNEHIFSLRHMLLMPKEGISKRLFHGWLNTHDFNSINELIGYGWIQEDIENGLISMHSFLYEVIRGFASPSFDECGSFIERLGREYVMSENKEIHYRDLMNLSQSVFHSLEIDDTHTALILFERIFTYLEKNAYYRTLRNTLEIMGKKFPFEEEKYALSVYEFYLGIVAWESGNPEKCNICFEKAFANLKPFNEENARFAIDICDKIVLYHLFVGKAKESKEWAENAIALREKYGFAEPLDYEIAKANLYVSSLAGSPEEPKTFEDAIKILSESPQMNSLFKKVRESRELKVTKKEFQRGLKKMQPEEFLVKGVMKDLLAGVKEKLEIICEEEKEYSNFDFFSKMVSVVMEQVKNKIDFSFSLSKSLQ